MGLISFGAIKNFANNANIRSGSAKSVTVPFARMNTRVKRSNWLTSRSTFSNVTKSNLRGVDFARQPAVVFTNETGLLGYPAVSADGNVVAFEAISSVEIEPGRIIKLQTGLAKEIDDFWVIQNITSQTHSLDSGVFSRRVKIVAHKVNR